MTAQGRREKSHTESSDSQPGGTIKDQVFQLLDKNPLLMPKELCAVLHLDYTKHGGYVCNVRTLWKYHPKRQQGSKCSSVHGWRGWTKVPLVLARVREGAVKVGWLPTRARNRWILWKEKLGRLQWFETGRVNIYARAPVTVGRVYQLICNAFSYTGLITDLKLLEQVLGAIRFKGAHYVFETDQRLPFLTISLFNKGNGVVIKVGDRTHPTAVEVIAHYPDWAEQNERLFVEVMEGLRRLFGSPEKQLGKSRLDFQDYAR